MSEEAGFWRSICGKYHLSIWVDHHAKVELSTYFDFAQLLIS